MVISDARIAARVRNRLHTWYWRARYWYMDTDNGRMWRIAGACIAALVVVLDLIKVSIAALLPPPPGEPQKAVIWWVVYLIVALVAAAISYALRPKLDQQQPTESKGPTTEDGQAGIYYRGTHWDKGSFLLAWKIVGRDPIKGKGGK